MAKTTRTKKVSDHYCTKEEAFDRVNLLLVGNGDPESGLAFKVARLADQFKETHTDVKEIKDSVKVLAKMYDDTFDAASSVASAFEQYKSEREYYTKGKESVIDEEEKKREEDRKMKSERHNKFVRTSSAIGLVITGLSFVVVATFTALNYAEQHALKPVIMETNKEVGQINSTTKDTNKDVNAQRETK